MQVELFMISWLSLCISLQDGLRITYFWIKEQIEKEKAQGIDLSIYGSSKVVGTQAPVQLGSLRAADGKEWSSDFSLLPLKAEFYCQCSHVFMQWHLDREILS